MRIGNVEIKGRLFLAPMSNVTSLSFRLLCKKYGAAVVYSEMINADAFIHESEKTMKRGFFLDAERPIGIQLSGSNEEVLKKAIVKAEKLLRPDIIDINIGCPAYNVMKSGCGAFLMEDTVKLGKIVKTLSNAISAPLTCKIRITNDETKTLEIAKILETSGAKAITVHGRTAKQMYSGKADWDMIRKIKQSAKIPVILNGDVADEESAKKAFDLTNCDAVMIGRAAIGNPFIFERINYYLRTGRLLPGQSLEDKKKDFLEFIRISKEYNYTGIAPIKMQAQNFMSGFEGARQLRQKISSSKDINEIVSLLGS